MAYQKLARRLKFLIEAYRQYGFAHVRDVFGWALVRRRYARKPIGLIDREAFLRAFGCTDRPDRLVQLLHHSAQRLFPAATPTGRESIARIIADRRPATGSAYNAEEYRHARFAGLGVCIDEPNGRFDWHRDYASGVVWPSVAFDAIAYMGGGGTDVKNVWELNRLHLVGWLGADLLSTQNRAAADAFVRMIDDWRSANPINVGVNWAMPMEVAIRGFWLLMGYATFYGAAPADGAWWLDYARLAWGHATYLGANLEYFFNLTNHYLSNCFGLVVLGAFFSDSDQGRAWLEDGVRRMEDGLHHQVLADGVHYERSVGYHRLVLEMYLIALVLAERAGRPFATDVRARVERMAEFTRDYTPPMGTVPQFGDSDDGVIMRCGMDQELYDHRDTLAMAAVVFNRADFAATAGEYGEPAAWLFGAEGAACFTSYGGAARPTSVLYRDGGFAILRGATMHVMADAGPIGLHGNNDTLAFTVHGAGGAFIVDPGTYCYTRDESLRNELRSTGAHNAPMIDGVEIAAFDGLWRVKQDRTATKVTAWEDGTNGGAVVFEAEHHAYATLSNGGVVVRRRFELHRPADATDELRVHDTLIGSGRHGIRARFTIPHGVCVERIDEGRVLLRNEQNEVLEFECSRAIEVRAGWYSPSYGVAAPATLLEVEARLDISDASTGLAYICRLLSKS